MRMKNFARRLGRLFILNPVFPGMIALLLTKPLQIWVVKNFRQPLFGNFYPEMDYHFAVISLFNFSVLALVPIPVSYFFYKKVTEKRLLPKEFQPRSFALVWFWVLGFLATAALKGPQTYTAIANMKTHAKPVANAETLALELVDLVVTQRFADLMKRLPAKPPVDQEEIETNLSLMAGDNLKLQSLAPFAIFGPSNKGRLGKLGTVSYQATLEGSKSPCNIYVFLEWKDGGWSPLWVDPGNLRIMDPEAKKVAEAYVQMLIEGEYQKGWQILPEDSRVLTYERYQNLAVEHFGSLRKPATPLAVASRTLAGIDSRESGLQVIIDVNSPNRKLRVHVGVKREPSGWIPVSLTYSKYVTD